ncbi:MAG: hypothetical protein L0H64_10990 [Pseudonocardia sp.]|nr:hypothetical protein [Pseudonocardia sp.]
MSILLRDVLRALRLQQFRAVRLEQRTHGDWTAVVTGVNRLDQRVRPRAHDQYVACAFGVVVPEGVRRSPRNDDGSTGGHCDDVIADFDPDAS